MLAFRTKSQLQKPQQARTPKLAQGFRVYSFMTLRSTAAGYRSSLTYA